MSGARYCWARHPALAQRAQPVYWRAELGEILAESGTTLAYGNGRSYGDVCLAESNNVIDTRGLNRWLRADWTTGIVTAEAGMTLGELLAQAIPRGFFLPVVPGTQYVTLGGAVANDVHGKNHHRRGTFGCHVRSLELVRSDRGTLQCSANTNAELFAATVGGLGLTGIITTVELTLVPIRSSLVDVRDIRFASLEEFMRLSQQLDREYEYTVAWLDCQSPRGRGIFMAGNHADEGPLQSAEPGRLAVPATLPVSAINRLTLPLLNRSWYHLPRSNKRRRRPYVPFFFPLDGIRDWHRLYGKRGFQQFQCVIPASEAERAITELLERIARSGSGSFLSVLKVCGDSRSPGLLSFPLPGISLALDFPNRTGLAQLLRELDQVVAAAGGRLYPAKDAHMSPADFQQGFPAWEQLEHLRDPALCSHFWRRVTGAGR